MLQVDGIGHQEQFCILHPGAKVYDRWEAEKYAEFADMICSQHQMKILLTCGPGEKNMIDEITSLIKNAPCAFIGTNLEVLGVICI